jgi:hypothetical protein
LREYRDVEEHLAEAAGVSYVELIVMTKNTIAQSKAKNVPKLQIAT